MIRHAAWWWLGGFVIYSAFTVPPFLSVSHDPEVVKSIKSAAGCLPMSPETAGKWWFSCFSGTKEQSSSKGQPPALVHWDNGMTVAACHQRAKCLPEMAKSLSSCPLTVSSMTMATSKIAIFTSTVSVLPAVQHWLPWWRSRSLLLKSPILRRALSF